MEGLLAEINSKKKDIASGDKYLRRGDAQRVREEEEARRKDEARKRKAEEADAASQERASKLRKEADAARNASLSRLRESRKPTPASGAGSPAPEEEKERYNLPPEECIRRLRSHGEPIRLFGETDRDRRLRLRAIELEEERGDKKKSRQDDFKRAVAEREREEAERRARGEVVKEDKNIEKMKKYTDGGPLDLGLIKTDFKALHPLIYWYFKALLKEWEEYLEARPDDAKRTAQGKLANANHAQSAQNLKPLFRGLKNRDLPEDVVRHLAEVVHFCQCRLYSKAQDAYLRLSIGNAAWPIGVVSVGIHERSNQGKISDNVAHVLNDEVSRKYIQAVKRLMTFCQTVRPPDSIAQMMG
jgi:pre-mRNA-splicing factor 18